VSDRLAADFPQFADLRNATPYATRHTFMSCCLQAGISLATVAGWCGTSIQVISETYGRMIRRYEGASPVPLDDQFQAGKVETMMLLSATTTTPSSQQGGPTGGPMTRKLPPAKRRQVAD
jgi:hypothetical protein